MHEHVKIEKKSLLAIFQKVLCMYNNGSGPECKGQNITEYVQLKVFVYSKKGKRWLKKGSSSKSSTRSSINIKI